GQLKVLGDRGLGGPPPSSRERLERAERLLGAGSGDSAKSEAEAILSEGLAPDLRGRAFKVLLESHRRAGRADAALATVNRALSSLPDPNRPLWLLELAQLQQRRSRDLALATADALSRQYPKAPEAAEALLLKARLLEETGRFAEAEAVYTRVAADRADEDM